MFFKWFSLDINEFFLFSVMEKYIRDKYERKLFLDENHSTNSKPPSLPPRTKSSSQSSPMASTSTSKSRYADSLSTLHDMGFSDDSVNTHALEETNGDVTRAIEKIVQHGSSKPQKPSTLTSTKSTIKLVSARLKKRNKNLSVHFEDGTKPGDAYEVTGDTRAASPTLNPFEQMMAMTNQGMSVSPGVETTSSPFFTAPVEPNQPLQPLRPSMTGPVPSSMGSEATLNMPSTYGIDSNLYTNSNSSSIVQNPLQPARTGPAAINYNYTTNYSVSSPSVTNPFFDVGSSTQNASLMGSTGYPSSANNVYYENSYQGVGTSMSDNYQLPDMSKLSLNEQPAAPSNSNSQYMNTSMPTLDSTNMYGQSNQDPYSMSNGVYGSNYSAQPSTMQMQATGIAPPQPNMSMQMPMSMQSTGYQMPMENTWVDYNGMSQQGNGMQPATMNYSNSMGYDTNVPADNGYYQQGYGNVMMPPDASYTGTGSYVQPMNQPSGGMGAPADSSKADSYIQRIMQGKQ